MVYEEYIEELLWFSVAWLCIVYRVCLIALCPNQRVQAARAGVFWDALCCGLSQRAQNIHSRPGSEGKPTLSSVNTLRHTHTHAGVGHSRDYTMNVRDGSHVCLHVTANYPQCDSASHSGKTKLTPPTFNQLTLREYLLSGSLASHTFSILHKELVKLL